MGLNVAGAGRRDEDGVRTAEIVRADDGSVGVRFLRSFIAWHRRAWAGTSTLAAESRTIFQPTSPRCAGVRTERNKARKRLRSRPKQSTASARRWTIPAPRKPRPPGSVCFQRPDRNLVVRVGREEEGASSLRPELAAIARTLQATSVEVDLLYSCDSEAALSKVSRWIGSGLRTW